MMNYNQAVRSSRREPTGLEFLPFVPRALAVEIGLKWYFDCTECPHGHVAKRSVRSYECRSCVVEA
jgi:hypothetical protein